MKKILWSYRLFVITFVFTSYIFYCASIDSLPVLNGDILYWIEDVSGEELKHTIQMFSENPIVFRKKIKRSYEYLERYYSQNGFIPDSVFAFETNIGNNGIEGFAFFDTKNSKVLLALSQYKYGDDRWEHFLWSRNFEKPLTVAKQFEENVLCNFPKIRTSRWRTIRGIYSTIFFDYQLLLYIAFIVIDIIIKSIHKRLNRQK